MDKTAIMLYANLAKDKIKKNGPKILLGTSIVSGVAALYFGIKRGMSVDPILDEHKVRIDEYKLDKVNDECSDKEYKKGLVKEYVKTFGYMAKHFALPVGLEAFAIGTSCAALGVEEKRYVEAAATAAALYSELSSYRARVANKYGEEAEFDIYNGVIEEVTEKETVDENGKKKKTKETNKVVSKEPGMFSFFLGKDYYKCWNEKLSDAENITEMKMRLAGAIKNTNRDVQNHGYVWFDDFAKRVGIQQISAYRNAAIVYDFDNWGEDDQFSVNRNIVIKDAHIMDGGEKVLLVEVRGLEVGFNVDTFDEIEFLKAKRAYKERIEAAQ